MKIENFALDLYAESTKSSSVKSVLFATELESQNVKRAEEIEALNAQVEFCKRLEFELIQQLLFALSFKSYKFEEVEQREFASREISIYKEYSESQKLDVSMNGFIETASRRIDINIDISMSHSFASNNEILRKEFYDPLVLSFEGDLPELDTLNFSFDIDCDGKSDQISMLRGKSGFLAYDKNDNGKIDDAIELFGAINGDGFGDLKRYDSDDNGWIDEEDPILDSLRVWIKTKDQDRLVALGEIGIGAIYLGNAKGVYDIKSQKNDTLGRIRSSGLFLNEDGTSGIISQIDFARQNQNANKELNSSGLSEFLKQA